MLSIFSKNLTFAAEKKTIFIMTEAKITVIINTYNAEKHLNEVLDNLKGFDELLLCDMESTDNTVAIARAHHCRIITFPKKNYKIVEPARNWAVQQASHPWILVVDADEIVPEALKDFLYSAIQKPDCPAGFYIPRKNFFMGRFMHCLYPDLILRFFKKEGTVWPPTVHSLPLVKGYVATIPPRRKDLAFIHLANENVSERIQKTNIYTDYEIERRKYKRYNILAFFYLPAFHFFKAYILKGGFKDGKAGLIRASLISIYKLVMLAKIFEQQHNK